MSDFNIPQDTNEGVGEKFFIGMNEEIEQLGKEIFIPKVTLEQGLEVGARFGAELAINAAGIANQSKPKVNPFNSSILAENEMQDSRVFAATDIETSVVFDSVKYGDITTPTLVLSQILISVTFPRNIVKTTIQGRNGTVKEYIGEGDASISFRGVLTAKNGGNPKDQIADLKKIISAPVAIPVGCAYLQNLGIYSVVFEDRTLEQEEGGFSYQAFTLNAVSDTPQEILIM